MFKRTERISFRISYVLSKVEPGVGVGSATLHVYYYSIRTHNSIQTASWVMWWYSKLLCPTKSPFFVTLICQQYQYFYNNLLRYFLRSCCTMNFYHSFLFSAQHGGECVSCWRHQRNWAGFGRRNLDRKPPACRPWIM